MKRFISALLFLLVTGSAIAQTTVDVMVSDDQFTALDGISVYAFDGATFTGSSAVTNASGIASFSLADGDYRFRADKSGTQYFSDSVNHCTTPACTTASVQVPRAVEVTVTSSAGGVEAGLNVYAFDGTTYSGKSAVSDASGVAILQLPLGNYRFRIDKNGTQFYTNTVNHCSVAGCIAASLEVPENITVSVTSAGAPEAGLNVYAFDGSTYVNRSAVTDVNGEAVFTLVPGDYRFRIDKAGQEFFTDAVNHCTAPGCNSVAFDIPVQVLVNVTSSAGGVEAGLNVYAFDGTTYTNESAITDANGTAVFTLLAGDYRFRIDKNGTQFYTDTVNHCSVPGCSVVNHEVPESITLSVTSSAGGAEAGLNVYAFDGASYTNKSAVTDVNGEAVFTLVPGDYRFRLDKNGTQFFTDTLNHCTAPGCNAVAYEVPENVTVTVNSTGGGVEEGLNVYAFDGATYINKSAVTNANGDATFTLVPGNYRFRIDKNGTQFFTDTVNHCTTPGCNNVVYDLPESVTVNVSNTVSGAEQGLNVYAFDEATYTNKSAVTDANGDASFTLLPGNYRFRTDKGGVQYFSNPTNHCAVPGCTSISQQLPASLSAFVVDPALGACLDAVGSANGWTAPSDVTSLSCDGAGVSNLSGLSSFNNLSNLSLANNPITLLGELNSLSSLSSLDLSGTTLLECNQLNSLETSLGSGVISHPASCLGEGDQVFGIDNPGKPDSNQFSFAIESTENGDLVSSAITYNPGTDSYDGRVYLIDGTNGDELLELQNPSPSGSDYFGWSISALANGNIAVGAWQDDVGGLAAGVVHLFDGVDGSLLSSIDNPNPTTGDRFGYAIAATPNGYLAIAAYQEGGGGAVYVFDGQGVLQQSLFNPTGDSNAEFGKALAVNSVGDIVIGAPQQDVVDGINIDDAGMVYVYTELGGTALLAVANPQAAINDDFGSAVAITANGDLIVSARRIDNNATNDGSVFLLDGSTGVELWSVTNPLADTDGLFGTALAGTPQGHILIGAANDDNGADNSGRVFVYESIDGELIKVIDNPAPVANVNFGQGLGVTPAGQIAVGAFGADGGYGSLYLFSSISVGEQLDLLNELPFGDANLQSCVLDTAAANGWATVTELSVLDCSNSDITDLAGIDALADLENLDLSDNSLTSIAGLDALSNLSTLDLSGNTDIPCTELDALEVTLGPGVLIRPATCDSGVGGSPQAAQVQSLHNALGQRVAKTVNGDSATALHFIYDQAGRVIAEIEASTGQTVREYVYVNGMQVALVDDTGTQDEAVYFVHNDHLGTPQKITDDVQTVVWGGSYQPFGEVEETVAAIENNIRFPGQYEDGETGLHYNYFRDYDPSIGRYVESDPIGLDGGVNTYAYVLADPINRTDAKGLASCDCRPSGGGYRDGRVKICQYRCTCNCPNDSGRQVAFTTKYSQGSGSSEFCFGQSETTDGRGRPVPHFNRFSVNTTGFFSLSSTAGFRAKLDARLKVECKDC